MLEGKYPPQPSYLLAKSQLQQPRGMGTRTGEPGECSSSREKLCICRETIIKRNPYYSELKLPAIALLLVIVNKVTQFLEKNQLKFLGVYKGWL